MPRHRAVLLAAALPLLLVACSGGGGSGSDPGPTQPPASAFREGSCRTLAPTVLAIGADARLLGEAARPPADVRERLKGAQDVLRQAQPGLAPDVAAPVQELVTAVGYVRLRSDTNTYTPELAQDVLSAYDTTVAACTGVPPAATTPPG